MEGFKIKLKKMRNIHVIPTDKPSSGYILGKCIKELSDVKIGQLVRTHYMMFSNEYFQPQNIYITSDEEIKRGDWYFAESLNEILQYTHDELLSPSELKENGDKKIILTTDLQLIADGVQAIDDEFIEWFVKNPSCEKVEVDLLKRGIYEEYKYKIIIPKEEPKLDLEKEMFELEQELDIPSHLRWHNSKSKQETTLEEAAKNYANIPLHKDIDTEERYFNSNVRDYDSFIAGAIWQQEQDKNKYSEEEVLEIINRLGYDLGEPKSAIEEWFEQFKKK